MNRVLKYNPRNIFLITGKNSYEKSGAKKIIGSILSGYRITHFYDFEVNPKLHDIENGISIFNKNDCNLSEVKYNMIKKTVYTDNDTYSSLYYIEYKTNLNSIFMFCIHI